MEIVKTVHLLSAYITGLGFLIRGVLVILQSPILSHRALKNTAAYRGYIFVC